MFGGVKIIVSDHAYERVPIFPDRPRTKRRMRRIRGKYGRLDRISPMMIQTLHGTVVHPKIYQKLKGEL